MNTEEIMNLVKDRARQRRTNAPSMFSYAHSRANRDNFLDSLWTMLNLDDVFDSKKESIQGILPLIMYKTNEATEPAIRSHWHTVIDQKWLLAVETCVGKRQTDVNAAFKETMSYAAMYGPTPVLATLRKVCLEFDKRMHSEFLSRQTSILDSFTSASKEKLEDAEWVKDMNKLADQTTLAVRVSGSGASLDHDGTSLGSIIYKYYSSKMTVVGNVNAALQRERQID